MINPVLNLCFFTVLHFLLKRDRVSVDYFKGVQVLLREDLGYFFLFIARGGNLQDYIDGRSVTIEACNTNSDTNLLSVLDSYPYL